MQRQNWTLALTHIIRNNHKDIPRSLYISYCFFTTFVFYPIPAI